MESMSVSPVISTANPSLEKQLEISKDDWMQGLQLSRVQRIEMNKLVMNYLVTEGYKEAAEKFHSESGVEMLTNHAQLDKRIQIKDAIMNGKVLEAMALINHLCPELLETNKKLNFHLHQQQTIELIREQKIEQALEYAQNHLAEKGEENAENLTEIEFTLALLAFTEPETSPYGNLLHTAQRRKVAAEVNAALLFECGEDSHPKLTNLVQLISWAQEELDSKKVQFPHMIDYGSGTFDK
ncbi:hypothetical protein HELRODRAFT_174754 [Helobdella robusta]|uniref:CTLH domain-containing protein n=1 Tax=Helobdella robusta TaxID=6412 RepID=T1F8F8_HELRO|nr:hypothetical protein HELRODRAFT_174754 [Helobdella robusta]ESO01210.1 hypothetical protein HELRODRAFT_174754 [Helobdella robusta]